MSSILSDPMDVLLSFMPDKALYSILRKHGNRVPRALGRDRMQELIQNHIILDRNEPGSMVKALLDDLDPAELQEILATDGEYASESLTDSELQATVDEFLLEKLGEREEIKAGKQPSSPASEVQHEKRSREQQHSPSDESRASLQATAQPSFNSEYAARHSPQSAAAKSAGSRRVSKKQAHIADFQNFRESPESLNDNDTDEETGNSIGSQTTAVNTYDLDEDSSLPPNNILPLVTHQLQGETKSCNALNRAGAPCTNKAKIDSLFCGNLAHRRQANPDVKNGVSIEAALKARKCTVIKMSGDKCKNTANPGFDTCGLSTHRLQEVEANRVVATAKVARNNAHCAATKLDGQLCQCKAQKGQLTCGRSSHVAQRDALAAGTLDAEATPSSSSTDDAHTLALLDQISLHDRKKELTKQRVANARRAQRAISQAKEVVAAHEASPEPNSTQENSSRQLRSALRDMRD